MSTECVWRKYGYVYHAIECAVCVCGHGGLGKVGVVGVASVTF